MGGLLRSQSATEKGRLRKVSEKLMRFTNLYQKMIF
jgi:hypothetical protein